MDQEDLLVLVAMLGILVQKAIKVIRAMLDIKVIRAFPENVETLVMMVLEEIKESLVILVKLGIGGLRANEAGQDTGVQ